MSEETLLKEQGQVLSTSDAFKAIESDPAKLLSDAQWSDILNQYIDYVAGDEGGLPRFGSLSILCQKTPFFVYDHPALLKVCDTAFATETMVGFSKEFFISLLEAELKAKKEGREEMSVAPLIIHELSHIMRGHHGRMRQFPHNIANIAQDISINQMIALAFGEKDISLGPIFTDGWGATKTEFDLFHGRSEEEIGQLLLSIAKAVPPPPGQQGQGDPQQSSGQSDSNSQSGGQGQSDAQENQSDNNKSDASGNNADADKGDNQQSSNGNGQKGDSSDPSSPSKGGSGDSDSPSSDAGASEGYSHDGKPGSHKRRADDMSVKTLGELLNESKGMDEHAISDQQLSNTLENNNLGHVKDALGLPDSDNDEAFAARQESQRARNADAVSTSRNIREQHSQATGRPAAGGHIDSAHDDVLNKGRAPEINWQAKLSDALATGDGLDWQYRPDHAEITAHVINEATGADILIGDNIPMDRDKGVAAFLLDTSASMPKDFQSELLAVAHGAITPPHDDTGFKAIYFGSADTSSRNDLIKIDYDDSDKMSSMEISGGGGTDFVTPIHEIVDFAEEEDLRLDAIVYLTDMGAYLPSPDELPENTPPIVFVTAEHYYAGLSKADHERIHDIGHVIEISGSEYKAVAEDIDIDAIQDRIGHAPKM